MTYKDLGAEVGELVDEKNTAYGNSFNVAEDFIKLLWPKGVPPESFNDMLCVVRIFDKLKRIATNKGYGGESPYRDIAGYALLGLMKDKESPKKGLTYCSACNDWFSSKKCGIHPIKNEAVIDETKWEPFPPAKKKKKSKNKA